MKKYPNYSLIAIGLLLFACTENKQGYKRVSFVDEMREPLMEDTFDFSTIKIDTAVFIHFEPVDFEQQLKKQGLINVKTIDSSIIVDLKYATNNNFLGINVYGSFEKAFLQPNVAEKLALAQLFLKMKLPTYSIVVYDAVRPRNIQKMMWDAVQLPARQKSKFLSNPKNGSLHNFGAAVDVSIVDNYGDALDMGTPYDYLGELAYPRKEQELLEKGLLNQHQIDNRELLRAVMKKAGFTSITTEWWHFNSCSRKEAYQLYTIIE